MRWQFLLDISSKVETPGKNNHGIMIPCKIGFAAHLHFFNLLSQRRGLRSALEEGASLSTVPSVKKGGRGSLPKCPHPLLPQDPHGVSGTGDGVLA